MIKRLITSDLRDLMTYFPVVSIVGPRQVGKTTLAQSIAPPDEAPTIYLDLEFPTDLARLEDPVLFFTANANHCIILDEIQRRPDLLPTLRSLIDRDRRPGRFILLGSASPELLRDSSESLAGRIAFRELTPLLLTEIADKVSMEEHWFTGGFPSAFQAPNKRLRTAWFRNFIQTYVERDIPQLGLRVAPGVLHKFLTMLAHFHGNLWNASTLAKSLGVTSPTTSRYLDFLVDAFLIRKLPPYFVNVRKRLVKSPKIYIRDSGLLHHLVHIQTRSTLQQHYMLGSSWEGYVIEQIANATAEELECYFYRTVAGTECDLLLVQSGLPFAAIEIKYTSAPKLTKGFRLAIEDLDTTHNFVITPAADTFKLRDDVTVCSLPLFLTELLPQLLDE